MRVAGIDRLSVFSDQEYRPQMGKLILAMLVIVLVVIAGGGVFLAVWDIPAPSTPVAKVIPNAQFAK